MELQLLNLQPVVMQHLGVTPCSTSIYRELIHKVMIKYITVGTISGETMQKSLVDQSRGSGGLVLPVRRQHRHGSVVSGQSVDSRFDQNQSELRVLVLSVSLQVLSDRDSLLDQEVKVLWDLRGQTVRLEDSQDLVAGDNLGLGNTVSVSQDNTNLRRSQTLSGVLDNLLNDLVRGQLEPRRSVSRVWKRGRGDTLTLNMLVQNLRSGVAR